MKLRSLLAVALLAPAVTFAASTTDTKSTSKTGTKAAAAPAKPASKTAAPTEASPLAGLEVGGFLGYETADLSGLALRLDGEVPFRELSPQVKLSLVGSLGYSRLTWDPGFDIKVTANIVKVVPAARFTLPLAPQFSVFGDAGLGLAYVSTTVKFPAIFGLGEVSDSGIHLMMRLGAGAWYEVNPQLKLGAMLEYDPIFGSMVASGNGVSGGSQSTFLIQAGMMYRL